MTRAEFEAVLHRLAAGWAAGDSEAVASAFADDVIYGDPTRYRFSSSAALVPFFEPPPGGQAVTWHRRLWDEAARTGIVEYTYDGHRRYHGVALVTFGADGQISAWREFQHVSELDWDTFVAGPDAASETAGEG